MTFQLWQRMTALCGFPKSFQNCEGWDQDRVHRTRFTPLSACSSKRLPGNAWKNGYAESFNCNLVDEILNVELIDTGQETTVLIARRHGHLSILCRHTAIIYQPPTPETINLGDLVYSRRCFRTDLFSFEFSSITI